MPFVQPTDLTKISKSLLRLVFNSSVFLVLILMLMSNVTSKNSARQISGSVLVMFLLLLIFTSRLFSLLVVKLMLELVFML